VDLAAALKLKISRFDQPRRPLADTLLIVADLLGAPIRLQSDPQDRWHPRLREPVALTMENCTLEQILTGLISQVGLTFRVEPDHLQLLPRN